MSAIARDRHLLVLFDGNALVHRAYHALPPLSVTRTGEPVGAVYGFASMLLKVLSDLKPTHYAIAFDRPGPTFRHIRSEAYKAQRPAAPEELVAQFQRVRQLVSVFRIPVFELDGYEADDVLGALSLQASAQGVDVVIVTGDLDTLQLAGPRVRVLTSRPGRAMSDVIVYDEAAVRDKYGISPQQLPDFKGLKGDPSDNISGVPGVGEKTAARLIQQFGSVEVLYEHLDEVAPERLRQTLQENEATARLSKELAIIVTDLPIALGLAECQVGGYDRAQATQLFRELEFSSLLPKLSQLEPEATAPRVAAAMLDTVPQIVNNVSALDTLLPELAAPPAFAIDLETTGLEPMSAELVGIALCPAPGRAYYIPVGHRTFDMEQLPLEQVLHRLKPLVESDAIGKVAHNGNYESIVLSRYGLELRNLSFDTMLAAHVLGEKALGLKALAFSKLGIEMQPITALIGSGARQTTMAHVSIAAAAKYACADAEVTLRLKELLETELLREKLWNLFAELEMPLAPVLRRMELNGVALDTALLRQMSQELGEQLRHLEAEIYNSVGHEFNINSSQQLSMVLFDELRLPHARRTKSGRSTEAAVLETLRGAHPVVEQVLEYRQLAKLKSTYVDALPALINPRTGRVHTSFNQTGTVTGRISSSEPNLQNIPIRTELGRRVRYAFIAPPPARLLAADYSQIDLRVLAHLSQDPRLVAAFRQDEDIHAATAAEVFGVSREQVTSAMRRVAKTVNFGVIYGMSDYGLEQATELSREEAAAFIKAYFEKYTGVQEYLAATKRQAHQRGYVETLLGRRRYIPEINSSNGQVRAAAERMAINMPVQGTSADIIKVAMVQLQQRLDEMKLQTRMILQIHDELLFEVPPDELEAARELVNEVMPRALELSVPLKVGISVGANWGEME